MCGKRCGTKPAGGQRRPPLRKRYKKCNRRATARVAPTKKAKTYCARRRREGTPPYEGLQGVRYKIGGRTEASAPTEGCKKCVWGLCLLDQSKEQEVSFLLPYSSLHYMGGLSGNIPPQKRLQRLWSPRCFQGLCPHRRDTPRRCRWRAAPGTPPGRWWASSCPPPRPPA